MNKAKEPTVQELCERLADATEKKDVAAGVLRQAEQVVDELRDALLSKMLQEGTEIVRAKGVTATVTKSVVPQVVDWPKFEAYVLRHKRLDLLQRRLSAEPWREIIDETGKPVPGVEKFEKTGIRVQRTKD